MPSRRMIDPSFWRSESMAELTKEQRLLFLGLISNADDQGRLRAHPALIRSDVFPFEDEPLDKIVADLEAIAATGSIVIYEADGLRCIQIVNWWVYQRPKWAWPSNLPAPPDWTDRERYRMGNNTVRRNWDGYRASCDDVDDDDAEAESDEDETVVGPERNQSETVVEPPRNQNETVVNPAPSGRISDSGRTSGREAGANAPARSPPTPPKKRNGKQKKPTPEAVKVFRANSHRYPAKAWYDDIEHTVGDDAENLERWGQTVKAWVGMGWNPTNVKGMLNCFERGEMPGEKRDGGVCGGRDDNVTANLEAADLWLEMTSGQT